MVYPHTYRTEHSETKTTNSVYGEYYAAKESKKIKIQPELLRVFQYIDSARATFVEDLAGIIKFKSISGKLKYRNDVYKLISFIEEWLIKIEMKYECFNIGFYTLDGKKVRIPSVILASLGNDPEKKTVCAYLHLDVPEPDMEKWTTDPWTLTESKNTIYGNGASCGKGPLMMWFHVIQAFQGLNMPLPVNIKFIIEFMNHENSLGLANFLATRLQDFFAGVNNVIVCESEWLGPKHPCLIYGCAGAIHFELSISKAEDSKTEIKDDMDKIVKSLVDDEGNILIKGYSDYVDQITPDEEKVYEQIKDFDIEEVRNSLPEYKKSWDQVKLLMSFWKLPSIHVHDTLECICDKQDFTKIKKVFTSKIVPRQILSRVEKLIKAHIKNIAKELKIENTVNCEVMDAKRFWFENLRLPCYNAARRAVIQVYKEDPNMIREAKAREAVTVLDRILEKNIVMLPLACRGSNPGGPNENISFRNYFEGTKVIAAYIFQISYIKD